MLQFPNMHGDFIQRVYYRLATPLFDSLRGGNLYLQITGIVLTIAMVYSGFDWNFYKWMGSHELALQVAFSAVIVGFFLPLVLPFMVYAWGWHKGSVRLETVALCILQAAILGLIFSASLKAITGRTPPDQSFAIHTAQSYDVPNDYSQNWNFGWVKRNVFDGWPSGHTTVAVATVTALVLLTPGRRKLHILLIAYALYMAVGVGSTVHWMSDAVAAGFMGTAIGRAVAYNHQGGKPSR